MKNEIAKIEKPAISETLAYAFVVVCNGFGFDRYTGKKISPKLKFACQTLQEASEICKNYIEEYNLGGSNWNDGTVYHPKLGKFANVSYNGRVWRNTKKVNYDTDEFKGADLLKTWQDFMPSLGEKPYDFTHIKVQLLNLSL